MIDDPFQGTFELANGFLGPELWQVRTALYTAAVRFNTKQKKFMLIAAGRIDGEICEAADLFEICPIWCNTTKTLLDNAFNRAGDDVNLIRRN